MLNLQLDEVFLDKAFEQKLDKICQTLGTTKEMVIISYLTKFVDRYSDATGGFFPKEAVLYTNSDKEQKKLGKCFVIEEVVIAESPYYRILYHGNLMSVPKRCIEFDL